jgi:hypothetical protein
VISRHGAQRDREKQTDGPNTPWAGRRQGHDGQFSRDDETEPGDGFGERQKEPHEEESP